MSLVADYGSDSSSENEDDPLPKTIVNPIPPQPIQDHSVNGNQQPSKLKKIKKVKKVKKKINVFQLPPEIQKALETGRFGSDDSDDEIHNKAKKNKTAMDKGVTKTHFNSALLNKLPPPKQQVDESMELKRMNDSTIHSTLPSTSEKMDNSTEKMDNLKEASNDGSYYSNLPHSSMSSHPSTIQQERNSFLREDVSEPTTAYGPGVDIRATQEFHQQQYAQMSMQFATEQKKRSRHDRDLERELQQGNFEGVSNKVQEITSDANPNWRPHMESGISKASQEAAFWNSQNGMQLQRMKPSRLQRQRHQLNQLAFDARVKELELAERKGIAMKSKRETQAKYGW